MTNKKAMMVRDVNFQHKLIYLHLADCAKRYNSPVEISRGRMSRTNAAQHQACLLLYVLALILVYNSHAYRMVRTAGRRTTSITMTSLPPAPNNAGAASAATVLVKKAKMKEVKALLETMAADGENHVVNKYMKDGQRAFGVGKQADFHTATHSRFESLSVIPEYNRKSKTGFIIGMPPPEILGGVLRDAGARAIVVSLDKRNGGASVEEFHRFTKEQTNARIMMPIPIPVVWHDFIVDDVQLMNAAAHGAAAVTLYPEYAPGLLDAQVKLCKQHNIEPIVMVKNVEDSQAGIAAGARCFCLHTLEETQLTDLRTMLPDSADYIYGARLRPESEFSLYAEIDTAWVLRDNKFNFVWPSAEAVYATGMSDIYPTVLAMRSKASRNFLSPRQFLMDRGKEGAKEYLGDILY